MVNIDRAESLGKRAKALYKVLIKLNSISGYHLGVEKAILDQAIAQLFEECPRGCEATFTGVFIDGDLPYMSAAGHYLAELLQTGQGPRVGTVSTQTRG